MAEPQLENGYTKIANELLEAVCRYGLTGTQLSIIIILMRYSYGYNRKTVKASAQFVADAINNKNSSYVRKELRKLEELNILNVVGGKQGIIKEYCINKNYEKWHIKNNPNDNIGTVVPRHSSTQDIGTVVPKYLGTTVPNIKENNKEKYKESNSNSKILIDEDVKKAINLYEQNIGVPSPIAIDVLRDIISSHSADLLELAISEAVKANAKSINYIEGIFRNWDNAGVKTVDSAKLAIAEHQNKKLSATSTKKENNEPKEWGHTKI